MMKGMIMSTEYWQTGNLCRYEGVEEFAREVWY